MWTVKSDYRKGELAYFVMNETSGECKGEFDCEPWAAEFAAQLNKIEEAKCVIRAAPSGNIQKRMEAIVMAKKILGRDITTEELHRWAET
jgi:hypothetical protein